MAGAISKCLKNISTKLFLAPWGWQRQSPPACSIRGPEPFSIPELRREQRARPPFTSRAANCPTGREEEGDHIPSRTCHTSLWQWLPCSEMRPAPGSPASGGLASHRCKLRCRAPGGFVAVHKCPTQKNYLGQHKGLNG